jgi:gamma-glutamyl-gamma-aminobutyrate hydrolase PuuD
MVNLAPPKSVRELDNYLKWLRDSDIEVKVLLAEDSVNGPLILSGGADIGVNRERDEREMRWIKDALDKGHPILGICRGMQLINHYLGGLVENINDLIVEDHLADNFLDDEDHHERLSQFHWVTHNRTAEKFVVNSRHHQCCAILARELKAVFYSEDLIIEAFVSKSGTPILGVQWHPEREEVEIPSYQKSRDYPVNWLKNNLKKSE